MVLKGKLFAAPRMILVCAAYHAASEHVFESGPSQILGRVDMPMEPFSKVEGA
jgi:hypothetical protein